MLQAYFPQPAVVAFGHVPVPLQVAELVWVPLLQLGSRQVVSAPGILHVAFVPSQLPAHFPLPPHAVCPVFGAPDTKPHVPGVVPLQNSHDPLQALLQHTPSAQLPVTHCVPAVHDWPCFVLQAPVASQVPMHRPFGSSIPLTAAQVWVVVLQAMQLPVQSAFVQQPVLGMQVVVPPLVHDVVEPVHE